MKTALISAVPNRFPGGAGQEVSISSQSHKGLLQRGPYNRWTRDAIPELMERRFKGKGSA